MSNFKYVFPESDLQAFNCPHCGAFAQQHWHDCKIKNSEPTEQVYVHLRNPIKDIAKHFKIEGVTGLIKCSSCEACVFITLWIDKKQIFPSFPSNVPTPNTDMPENIKILYMEAAQISNASPRSAAALLRLCLETLIISLEIEGKNLYEKIGNSGWPKNIIKACDTVRIYGNNAVHPGQIDTDDTSIVETLFKIVNYIIEQHIHMKNIIDDIYESMPETQKRKQK